MDTESLAKYLSLIITNFRRHIENFIVPEKIKFEKVTITIKSN